ncbi:MAG: acetylxylan esterase [Candidatus Omnitrophica bacterium]|nr:acetylxylan esterase [Candidatus Omnitrophota bacterium]
MRKLAGILTGAWILTGLLFLAAPAVFSDVELKVDCDHGDWVYKVAEPITFTITASEDGNPIQDVEASWRIGPEQMTPFQQGKSALKDGKLVLTSHGLDRPGFLRCNAEITVAGKTYRGLATGAYEAERIEPTTPMPEDFVSYWENEIKKVDELPLEPVMEKVESQSDDEVDVYHISYVSGPRGWRSDGRFYGMLAVPKGEGKFPALLAVPGAGIRPYSASTGWAKRGVIHLSVGIHGIPVNLPQRLYDSLSAGALRNYWEMNLDDRDRHYYHRVFLGCKRAVDFIFQLEQFDGKTLGIHGGSQGGALSIITAALDKRIRFSAPTYPAMCDHYGYLNGRAGGWPHLFRGWNPFNCKAEKIKTAAYYDVVNFSRILEIPVFMGLGYNDETCPPTSMFSSYNSIPSEKEIQIIPIMGHWSHPDRGRASDEWLMKHLKPSE